MIKAEKTVTDSPAFGLYELIEWKAIPNFRHDGGFRFADRRPIATGFLAA